MENIAWNGTGTWIEPFLGSGVVLFNVRPQRAIISDINPHIIAFYQAIYEGVITPQAAKTHLQREGAKLREAGKKGKDSYYYQVRERFNTKPKFRTFTIE
ncbi:MAG: DNA adenine methylase [Chloroflexi bacterium]|nr:DNA adenine methylase [Chloroflexota bacterium]